MSDNLEDHGPRDRSRIDVSEPWELRYWSSKLGIDEDQLKEAVAKVGPVVGDIRRYLRH